MKLETMTDLKIGRDKYLKQRDELLEALKGQVPRLESLINLVSTGDYRNKLTDENITIQQLIKNCK